jgi:zinc/manganese transport system permease protein
LFLSLSREYSQAVYALLFGEVLGVSSSEIAPVAILSVASVGLILLLFRPLLLNSVSEDLGAARGVSGRRIELLFLAVLGLTTAMALPVVGALLVFSLMIGPASAARLLTDRPVRAVFFSAGIALLSVWAALALSYLSNWPVGFFVGTLAAMAYGLGRSFARARTRLASLKPGIAE